MTEPTARQLAEQLRSMLPPHAFAAVVGRAARLSSEPGRVSLLRRVMVERRRSEAYDRERAAEAAKGTAA